MNLTLPSPRDGSQYQVLAYLRVSNDLQQDNHTFETQEKRIREKLDLRYGAVGYNLKIYKDDGLSGGYGPIASGIEKRTRPTLKAMETEIKSGLWDCLAVYHTSRWFRSARWLFQYLEDVIDPSGVDFVSATEDIDIKTHEGRTMLGILAVVNASYREGAAKRNQDAIVSRMEDGFTVGPVPYGWQAEPRREQYAHGRRGIIPDPSQAPHLIFMRDLYLAGHGGQAIAGELNKKGIPSAKNSRWNNDVVLRALKNPIHAGLVLSKKDKLLRPAKHYDERIWERDVYEEILRICERNKRYYKTNTAKADSSNIFGGVITCARCGARLYPMTGRKYRAFQCLAGKNYGEATCRDITVLAESIEDAVVRELEQASLDPQIRQILMKAATAATEADDVALEKKRQSLSKELEKIKAESDRLLEYLGRNTITESRFAEADRKLQQRGSEVSRDLQQVEQDLSSRQQRESWAKKVQQAILDFPLCWENATLNERRQLIATLVEKLTIDRAGRDAVGTMKIFLLPERQFSICFKSARHIKDRPIGVEGLTRRQLAFLHHVGLSKSYKEISATMGTGIANIYTLAMQVRRYLGVRDMQDAYVLAQHRIKDQMAFLPLGPSGRCKLRTRDLREINPCLLEVLPLLARGASYTEVARRTGLTPAAVSARRKRILEFFQTKSIFDAGERARALGLLDENLESALKPSSGPKKFLIQTSKVLKADSVVTTQSSTSS